MRLTDPGWPGINFKARPVVGGSFAFLALERACDGKAVAGLSFLDEVSKPSVSDAKGDARQKGDGEL